jgi:hypothetical protein
MYKGKARKKSPQKKKEPDPQDIERTAFVDSLPKKQTKNNNLSNTGKKYK